MNAFKENLKLLGYVGQNGCLKRAVEMSKWDSTGPVVCK